MFKSNLSENAKKRINILKNNNDGFKISEEDMRLRGYGDLLGFKQSGIKSFRLADPVINENLFILAEREIKKIVQKNQVFWVCPLIEESKKVDHQSSIKRYESLKKIFKNKVGIIHGSLQQEEKNKVLQDFLNKKIDILVSTTVIEVGIDFPNANIIIIENANKFGLSQLHQLRGRVGRGDKESYCILLFKSNLSQNAKKRINILKKTTDGFKISARS